MKYQDLIEYNEWWNTGKVPGRLLKSFKRDAYFKVLKYLDKRQITSIVGLRRIGKTTIAYQLIDHLISQGVKEKNIVYFSFDEHSGAKPSEVLDIYANEILNKSLNSLDKKIYVFFDEIQKAGNWENQLKKYYDLNYKIKFIISGSASLKIREKTKETLAGRTVEEKMQTLSFKEFLGIKKVKIENLKLQEAEIKPLFYEYVRKGGFPEFVDEDDEEFIKNQINGIIIDRIIYQDIPEVFKVKEPSKLMSVLKIISNSPGMLVDYQNIGSDLGITRQTVSNMFDYLSNTFLIKVLYNFSKNRLTSERKLKKCYLADTALVNLYSKDVDKGKLIEDLIISHLDAKFFWRKNGYEVDIILDKKSVLIPIEVKYKNTVAEKDIKGLVKFMDLFGVEQGFVVTKDISEEKKINGKKIIFIPVWLFLLTSG